MSITAVILLAGSSTRFNSERSKQFFELNNKPLVYYAIKSFEDSPLIDHIVLVYKPEDIHEIESLLKRFSFKKVQKIVAGGTIRQESSYIGLQQVTDDYVLIHDGARPIVDQDIIARVVKDICDVRP